MYQKLNFNSMSNGYKKLSAYVSIFRSKFFLSMSIFHFTVLNFYKHKTTK